MARRGAGWLQPLGLSPVCSVGHAGVTVPLPPPRCCLRWQRAHLLVNVALGASRPQCPQHYPLRCKPRRMYRPHRFLVRHSGDAAGLSPRRLRDVGYGAGGFSAALLWHRDFIAVPVQYPRQRSSSIFAAACLPAAPYQWFTEVMTPTRNVLMLLTSGVFVPGLLCAEALLQARFVLRCCGALIPACSERCAPLGDARTAGSLQVPPEDQFKPSRQQASRSPSSEGWDRDCESSLAVTAWQQLGDPAVKSRPKPGSRQSVSFFKSLRLFLYPPNGFDVFKGSERRKTSKLQGAWCRGQAVILSLLIKPIINEILSPLHPHDVSSFPFFCQSQEGFSSFS